MSSFLCACSAATRIIAANGKEVPSLSELKRIKKHMHEQFQKAIKGDRDFEPARMSQKALRLGKKHLD